MPFKFACEHCDRVLSVSSSKIGRRAKCPGCGESLTVPDKDAAVESMKQRKATPDDEEAVDPFAQFMVFDDAELVYETADFKPKAKEQTPVDHDKVAVSRRIVYVQGVLLGVVALSFFMFGILVGSATKPDRIPTNAVGGNKCSLTGIISYRNGANGEQPDSGAVVVLLPKGTPPDERVAALGLRPNNPPNTETARAKHAIREIGGYWATANDNGEFKVEVASSKTYYVLYVSGNANRQAGSPTPQQVKDITEMEEYIFPASDLLGQNQFRWQLVTVLSKNPMQLENVMFE